MSATQPSLLPKEPEAPKRSLVRKLSEVMTAVGWIEKTGFNEFHKYQYAQEADLVNALRGELSKRQVFIFPSVKTCERSVLEVETMKWDDSQKRKVPTVRKTQLTEIAVDWTFVDGESGEERTITVHGVGEDNVDKGFYKAFTGSEKYMLMKSFLIPTGDDPEKDSKEDAQEAKLSGKEAAQAVAKEKISQAAKAGNKTAQAAQKREEKASSAKVSTLFYSYPSSHNGHFAEWLNIPAYIWGNQDKEDDLRLVFSAHGAKKAKDGSVLVPQERMEGLLTVLAGDYGVAIEELKPR
jgi:hypothetical protein